MRGVNNLQSLPLRLGETLVVAHLSHDVPHLLSELRLHLLEAGVGVLDGVVEDGRYDDLRVSDPGLGSAMLCLVRLAVSSLFYSSDDNKVRQAGECKMKMCKL